MKLPIPYTPNKPYCIICGNATRQETCMAMCTNKLKALREAIRLRKSIEGMGITEYDERTIRSYNRIQSMLKLK